MSSSYPCSRGKGDLFSHLQHTKCSAAFANAKILKMAMFGDFFHKHSAMAQYTKLKLRKAIKTETKPKCLNIKQKDRQSTEFLRRADHTVLLIQNNNLFITIHCKKG
jgi:hypothetical protein